MIYDNLKDRSVIKLFRASAYACGNKSLITKVQDLEKTKTFALENGTTNNKSML
jgi:hypothetical protein